MNLIERYVFARICRPLVIYLFGGMIVLITQRTIELLDLVLEKRRSPWVVLDLLVHWVPNYLAFAAYIGLYLALLFGFSKLSKNSEVTGMLSVGYGFPSVTKLIVLQATLITAVCLLIIGWIQPHALHSFREMIHFVGKTEFVYLVEQSTFFKRNESTFFIQEIDHKASKFKKIFVYKQNADNSTVAWTGKTGVYHVDPQTHESYVVVTDAVGLQVPAESYDFDSKPVPAARKMNSQSVLHEIGKHSAGTYRSRGTTEQELTLSELVREVNNAERIVDLSKLQGELHFRIAQCLLAFILPFMAIPYSARSTRASRPYNILFGLLALVAIHQILLTGRQFVKTLEMSAYLTLWIPMSVFCLIVLVRYWRFCFKVPTVKEFMAPDTFDNWRATWTKKLKAN